MVVPIRPKSPCRECPRINKEARWRLLHCIRCPFPFFVARLHGDAMIVTRDRMRLIWRG
jgi:hypothetical protein